MIDFSKNDEHMCYLKSLDEQYYKRTLDHIGLPIFVFKSESQLIYTNPEGKSCLEKYNEEELFVFFNRCIAKVKECYHSIICSHDQSLDENFSTSIITPVFKAEKDKIPEYYMITIQKVIKEFDGNAQMDKKQASVKKIKNRKIVGRSHEFLYPLVELERIACYDISILLLGESGTGKTHIAEYIHKSSNRRDKAFMSINCGAIPGELLESELFGYASGAFTGANTKGKKGLFELADGGTIFLDEIGDMPLNLQVKLLHVLETGTFVPVGGEKSIKVNIRIISATNKNLLELIDNQTFRNDLYWRINSIIETIPPLRERQADIVPLALFFLETYNIENKTNKVFHPQTLEAFMLYHWPGNVRELKNIVKRMCVLTDGLIIYKEVIPKEINKIEEEMESHFSFDKLMDQIKATVIQAAVKKNKTSVDVAHELGLSQPTAYRLMKMYDIK